MLGPVLIEGNGGGGISLIAGSIAFSGNGAQTVQGNAANGIYARGNSHLELWGATIVNNKGRGLYVQDNSSVLLVDTTVTGNSSGGIGLFSLSSGTVWSGNNIKSNGGADFYCSQNSFGSGDKTGMGKMSCRQFNQQ